MSESLPALTDAEREAAAARLAARREADERADEAINFTMEALGRRLLVAHYKRRGEDVTPLRGLTPQERQNIAMASPALYYSGRYGWTAVGECKPRGHKLRLIRGHGRTVRAALRDLDRQLDRFERGERDGEQ